MLTIVSRNENVTKRPFVLQRTAVGYQYDCRTGQRKAFRMYRASKKTEAFVFGEAIDFQVDYPVDKAWGNDRFPSVTEVS